MKRTTPEEDREVFMRLATKRLNNALKQIKLIGDLSTTPYYRNKKDDVKEIYHTLYNALDKSNDKFSRK